MSTWKHVGVYAILLVLVTADYVLLHQSLVMLNRTASAAGSISGELYLVTAGFSVMMILLPHIAAIVGRRIADGILYRGWSRFLVVIGVVWVAVLVLVTAMRIAANVDFPTAAQLATGISSAGGVDLLAPSSLMAYMTAFFLTATGLASFFITWFTSRPLLVAVERAEKAERAALQQRDASAVAVHEAESDLESAKEMDQRDAERLLLAKKVVDERMTRLRADIFAVIAEAESDPSITSHLMRELNARRDPLTVLPLADKGEEH
ncbi:hypothetical protein [uncultured Amnibacterium sp.]|uniref:hypothetical protein n=1 Tax=uncultured Amnibacterium sp. TaxID=1631851 RepID=UPI0035C94CCA